MNRIKRLFIVLIICLFLFLIPKNSIAFDKKSLISKDNRQSNTVITTIKSEIIDVKREQKKINFLNNVIVEREDTSYLADKMVVYYSEDNEDGSDSSIDEIYSYDNVKVFNQEFTATGDKGVYNPNDGIFIIEGNTIFNNGVSIAKGKKFVYDINTQKGYLVGEKNGDNDIEDKRVIVIINEDELEKSQKEKEDKKKEENKEESDKKLENNLNKTVESIE